MLFKIGDRVRYVGSGLFNLPSEKELYNGEILTVKEIWEDYAFPYGSICDGGKLWFLCEEELLLANAS